MAKPPQRRFHPPGMVIGVHSQERTIIHDAGMTISRISMFQYVLPSHIEWYLWDIIYGIYDYQ